MRVVQINCVYPTGSTGKIVLEIHRALFRSGIESVVCYGLGEASDGAFRFCRLFEEKLQALSLRLGLTSQYGGSNFATSRLLRFLRKTRPDVVHLHCLNGNCVNVYKLLKFLSDNAIPTVVTNHAEFWYTGSCYHACDCNRYLIGCGSCPRPRFASGRWLGDNTDKAWKRMKKAFDSFQFGLLHSVAVSPWVAKRMSHSPILSNAICHTVLNGLDENVFNSRCATGLRNRLSPDGKPIVFFPAASFSMENGDFKGGDILPLIAELMSDVTFVVAALRFDGKIKGLPDNVIIYGTAESQERLSELYSISDVTLILSRRETFSMTCAESLCCGTPVAGFKAGGPESIAIPEYSRFVDQGDIDALVRAIEELLSIDKANIAAEASEKYCKSQMTREYLNIYKNISEKHNGNR